MRKYRALTAFILSAGLFSLVVAGCGDDADNGAIRAPTATPTATPIPLTTTDVLQPGPYGVGVTTMTFEDTSRPTMPNGTYAGAPTRTLVTEMWYPTETQPTPPDVEVRDATLSRRGVPYPLIVYSHGFMSNRFGGAYLARHLASYGYVTISPDFPLTYTNAPGNPNVFDLANQPSDVTFLIDRLLSLNTTSSSPFAGAIDAQRIGLTGLSLGGSTTFLVAFHPTLHDPRVRAAAPMAGGACPFNRTFYGDRNVPLLIVHGDIDAIVPYEQNAVFGFEEANPPKYLATLIGGSHTAFTEGAEIIFEAANNPDDVGCAALVGTLPNSSDPEQGQAFLDALGGAAAGVVANNCPSACTGPKHGPHAMRPSRQHQLTIASIFPFFEWELRQDTRARQYLETMLAAENADVTLQQQR